MKNEEFVESQKKAIELRISELEGELSGYKKYSEMGSSDDENVQEFEVFEEKSALAKNAEKELDELKDALVKIENNKYGKCEVCGSDIESGRLKAYLAAKNVRYSRKVSYFLIAFLVAILDVISKAIVQKYFARFVVLNDNVAFGVGLGGLELVATFAITATLIFFLVLDKIPSDYELPFALIIGGGIGNIIDRVADGYISDFINFDRFLSFNIADSFITAGIVIILYRAFRQRS